MSDDINLLWPFYGGQRVDFTVYSITWMEHAYELIKVKNGISAKWNFDWQFWTQYKTLKHDAHWKLVNDHVITGWTANKSIQVGNH